MIAAFNLNVDLIVFVFAYFYNPSLQILPLYFFKITINNFFITYQKNEQQFWSFINLRYMIKRGSFS